MKTYIALFRGINVGGINILPMKELITLFENLGSHSVKTYIQSGNVVFRNKAESASMLSNRIRAAIQENYGFEPHVLLLCHPPDIPPQLAGEDCDMIAEGVHKVADAYL